MNPCIRAVATTVRAWRRTRGRAGHPEMTKIVVATTRDQVPAVLHPRRIYQIGIPGKWAVMDCPCGHGHLLELNLAQPRRVQWTLGADSVGRPSLFPSVDYRGTARCHFWLRNGQVQWVNDRRPSTDKEW